MIAAPMWPDYALETEAEIDTVPKMRGTAGWPWWRVSTCTLRPPVVRGRGQTFFMYLEAPNADAAREWGGSMLMSAYLKAHPNNCAGIDIPDR